jgi:phosphopantothenate---cysteine ligase (CTP)
MNILVTAGNTQVLIDQVRCITNIFTGRTGARIALNAHARGHTVTLLTSNPEVVESMREGHAPLQERWTVRRYRTFEDLQARMEGLIPVGSFDAIIHSAAVSDYAPAGIFSPAPGTQFRTPEGVWQGTEGPPALVDRRAGKVKSDAPEMWLRLVRTPKLIDRVRRDWGFRGVLVKFKLEVGVSDEQLLEIGERSRQQSGADLMAANTLEGASVWAYLGPLDGGYQRVSRQELWGRLLEAVERLHRERAHG